MPRDLVHRPDWGPPASHVGGRLTPGNFDNFFSPAASTIAGGHAEARRVMNNVGLPELTRLWEADQAGMVTRVADAQQAIAVIDALPDQDRRFVINSFDALSSPCRMAILEELGMGKPGGNSRATAKQIADFEDIAGKRVATALKNRWRGRYERNVRRCLNRLGSIYSKLSATYQDQLDDWNSRLSVGQVCAVCAALAGE
jgi:hypothetical protein